MNGRKMIHIVGVVGFVVAPLIVKADAGDSLSDADSNQVQSAIHSTRMDYSKFDSPESVTVITQEQIRSVGILDISEIFRIVPGFRIVKIGDESRVSYHGTAVRENRRMRVTINGRNVLIGDGQYVEFDRLPIAIEDISRVTITRGPNGAAFGDNAFLANIDFQTIGRNDSHVTALRVAGGDNDRSKYSVITNQELAGFDINLSAVREKNGGYDYSDTHGTPRNDGKEVDRGQVTIARQLTERSLLELNASAYDGSNPAAALNQTGTQTNSGEFFELSNKTNIGENSRLDIAVSHNHQKQTQRLYGCFTPETVSAWLNAVQSPALRDQLMGAIAGVSAALQVSPSDSCFFDDLNIESNKTEAEVEFESKVGAARYVAGASATKVEAESDQYFAGRDQEQRTNRLFAEGSYSLRNLHFSLGGMGQHSDNVDGTQYAGRAAINWSVAPNQSLRYAYSESFRVPSLIESVTLWQASFCFRRSTQPIDSYVVCQGPAIISSNIKVEPERIHSHSIGYFGTFLGDALTVDVKVFHDKISDPIISNYFFFSAPPSNGPAFTLKGAETEMALRLNPKWSLTAQYSYLDSNATQTFELGMQGNSAESFGIVFKPVRQHTISLNYYANSNISLNDYQRLDAVYNYLHEFARSRLKFTAIYQRHITNLDGIGTGGPLGVNQGVFKDKNQFFGTVAFEF